MIKEYTLKDGKKLQLKEDALNHITKGCFVTRPMSERSNMTVLSGGLHTYSAWIEFKNKYLNELEHILFYNSKKHNFWYYARELSNGVIVLRIPRELFTGKAAKITMYPDDYYKSGFLWKTLFPKAYDRNEIINVIDEALLHENIEQRQKGQIIGYVNNSDSQNKMKVVIQFHGKDIKSVFPAWTQPNSGNNGKPYSHYDNIGFIISQSTEYFDDVEKINISPEFYFSGEPIKPERLQIHTPQIFTCRNIPSSEYSIEEWKKTRLSELEQFNPTADMNDLIFRYLNDFVLIKRYPELMVSTYAHKYSQLQSDKSFFNTFQIIQNFVDGLNYLWISKQHDKLFETISFMMSNMVSYTVFDLLLKKKILSTIINIVISINSPELSYRFIILLSRSPIRREAYIEYNLDTLNKKRLKKQLPLHSIPDELFLIMNPGLEINLNYQDFIEILKESVGETYTLNFKDEVLEQHLKELVDGQSDNYKDLIKDGLSYFCRDDFISFSECAGNLFDSALQYPEINEQCLVTSVGVILRDYCRIQFAHRQRINARYVEYHGDTNDIYFPIDNSLLMGTILKHERWTNSTKLEAFIKSVITFAESISCRELKNDAENFMKKIGTENPPLPER